MPTRRYGETVLYGSPVAAGIGVGPAVVRPRGEVAVVRRHLEAPELEAEVERFRAAVAAVRTEFEGLLRQLEGESAGDPALIVQSQLDLLADPHLAEEPAARIRLRGINAGWALAEVWEEIRAVFAGLGDAYIASRAADIRHLVNRILERLDGGGKPADPAPGSILVVDELAPDETIRLAALPVAGFVCELGSLAGHAAILARTLGIPTVMGVADATRRIADGTTLVVDGRAGSVTLDPSKAALARARRRDRSQRERFARLLAELGEPTILPGGEPIEVQLGANIELPEEVPLVVQHGAQGVGLYRTEYLYLDREAAPTVDELTEHYRSVVRALGGRPVTFRTIDLGGDKLPRSIAMPVGRNPALGLRGIRFSLQRPQLFDDQIRAILRAGELGPVRLMLPLISGWHELDEARRRITAVADEEGLAVPPLGVMIETPASVAIVDLLCRDADFLSLGTNDLVQYTLAIDRADESVAHLYTPLHPAILRMLRQVAETAARSGTELAVCGEMAGDPLYVPLLLGLGVTRLSMAPPAIPAVAALVRRLPMDEARAAAQGTLALLDPEDIERHLQRIVQARMGDLVDAD